MTTPIFDFVRRYADAAPVRLHMPGHKGVPYLGPEPLDVTEIPGADSLYAAVGIIRESEQNASALFGAETLYSTEGSSLCVRAMLYLAVLAAPHTGARPVIAAGRNAHRAFHTAAALLDLDVRWLYPPDGTSHLTCAPDLAALEAVLAECPAAVYLTAPDYLGGEADLVAAAQLCHAHGVPLLADGAHGAYLKFLSPGRHPIELGADLACASAHKTLPVLTGGAYLHIGQNSPAVFRENARAALAMFGSTSPSYLILQSLDLANAYLADGYSARLQGYLPRLDALRDALREQGLNVCGTEPLKLTIAPRSYGYSGTALAARLASRGITAEFADREHLVLLFTPDSGDAPERLLAALREVTRRPAVSDGYPVFAPPKRILSIREAALAPRETLPLQACIGRILADPGVQCPPAVPPVAPGERIDADAASFLAACGVSACAVVR